MNRLISEDEFLRAVIDLAKLRGWRVAHFRPARTRGGWRTPVQGHNGFPDLVLARNGVVIFAELKTDGGKLSEDQQTWAHHLGGSMYLWRPAMLLGEISNILQ